MKAELYPIWAGGRAGYLYNVVVDGELVLDHVAEPVCDLARVLLARGLTGKVTLVDGNTGKPRLLVDIEKCAKLTVEEGPCLPRFRKYRERGGSALSNPEETMVVPTLPDEEIAA